jgi:peptide methionine sulfoxide reductase msrA/msrB
MPQYHVFNHHGQLVGPVESPRVELSDEEWRRRLTPAQYQIIRSKGTERPFCGTLLDNKKEGVYQCAGCGLPLFASNAKFNSGTGWPSFFQPIARENVVMHPDTAHGMQRVEILCARCDAHLGHVFDDGPKPSGLRYCLNSESLNFTPADKLASLADPAADSLKDRPSAEKVPSRSGSNERTTATAVFAGGCFWCTEAAFEQLDGVSDVQSGYTGGSAETANYRRVCDGDTGHAEAIRITYYPQRITYEQLLDVFFDAHDPTQLNGQGADLGTQYRSAIFFANEAEKKSAEEKIGQLSASRAFSRPIVTKLEPLGEFYPAEDYHQDYARQNPDQPYIRHHALPKACKVREKHADLVRRSS